jgi:hypothetical protein
MVFKSNGIDSSTIVLQEFSNDCEAKSHCLTFNASHAAHHQNGVAEHYIGTMTPLAHAMLLHSAFLWPREHHLDL